MLLLYSDSEKLQMRDRDKTRKIWTIFSLNVFIDLRLINANSMPMRPSINICK